LSKLVHLHCHDEYSFDAVGTSKHFAQRAAEMGQAALGKTNHGTLAGTIHHINACRDAGVLPIVGLEAYYRPERKVQGQKDLRYDYFHMTLLAKNSEGWQNLMRMNSEAAISGFYEKPCIDLELVRKYHEGLVCGLGCLRSVLCKFIEDGDSTAARGWLRQLKSIFGDDLFGEIMPSKIDDQVERNLDIVSLCQDESVMICSTVDAHAPSKDWVGTQDVRLMILTNTSVKQREAKKKEGQEVFEFRDDTYYLQSEEEVLANLAEHHPGIPQTLAEESIGNTLLVAAKIAPIMIGRGEKLPKFKRKRPDIEILRDLVYEGLERHGKRHDEEYEKRAEMELGQIERAGIAPYMLMVHDIVDWAKSDRGFPIETRKGKGKVELQKQKEPIEVGPGRGSAAGSLVCDCIGITNMDPIAYRLQFERFYNIDRKGLPDIDVDFPTDRIDEVEKYTKMRFGEANVLDVIAHSTFGPRACIRRVGNSLCLPHNLIEEASKSIDETDRSPLEELLLVNHHLRKLKEEYPEAWGHMTRLQGQIMGKSEHAAALLVTPPELPAIDVIPIERIGGQKGKLITAWGERAGKGNALLSDHGFMKFDWLRVAELDKQAYAVKLIEDRIGERVSLKDHPVHRDPYAVEPEVMKAFGDGLLAGVFQFSATAARLTRKVKPTSIFDLAAITALIRPGPRGVGYDQKFVERKHGREEVTYWHQKLEPYLDYTLGLMVFQEQLIEVVHQLGGLSRVEADNFRKIASKLYRDPEYARSEMGKWKNPIGNSFVANGFSPEEFEDTIWPNFLSFSDYSFNLAHAGGYALLAFRDMWLKVKYPWAFYPALLYKGLSQVKEKRQVQKEQAVREARNLESFGIQPIDVLPPDVNESDIGYTVTENFDVRVGLEAIRNVGPVAAREVIKHRPYASYADFEKRVMAKQCNRTSKAALVCAGAFDRFGARDDFTEERIDELEREFIGVSLTSKLAITNYADVLDPRIWTEEEFDSEIEDTRVTVGGEVVATKEIVDKKGGKMCFVDLAYGPNEWSCTFFSHIYPQYKDMIESRRPLIVVGKKNTYKDRSSVVVEEVMDVDVLAEMVRESKPSPEPAAA
jgi:DNA polymerase-3 subunit alpha